MIKLLAFLLLLPSFALAQQVKNPVSGPATSVTNSLAFWASTYGDTLSDRGWKDDSSRLTAPLNRSITLQGTGGLQLGGPTGPFILNDTALDTISVQAQPGALPSGDTTNFQLYPPQDGGKVFLNLVSLASAGGLAGEQRLIIGSSGAGSPYVFSQVVTGSGHCRDVVFSDGVYSTQAWAMKCSGGGLPPSLELGPGVPLMAAHPTLGSQSLVLLDTNQNLNLGIGANVKTIAFSKPIGSIGTAPTVTSCGTSPTITSGTNTKGLVTVGTGGPTSCTVNFSTP